MATMGLHHKLAVLTPPWSPFFLLNSEDMGSAPTRYSTAFPPASVLPAVFPGSPLCCCGELCLRGWLKCTGLVCGVVQQRNHGAAGAFWVPARAAGS